MNKKIIVCNEIKIQDSSGNDRIVLNGDSESTSIWISAFNGKRICLHADSSVARFEMMRKNGSMMLIATASDAGLLFSCQDNEGFPVSRIMVNLENGKASLINYKET